MSKELKTCPFRIHGERTASLTVAVDNEYERWWNGALDSVVDNAPTVIEAEGRET